MSAFAMFTTGPLFLFLLYHVYISSVDARQIAKHSFPYVTSLEELPPTDSDIWAEWSDRLHSCAARPASGVGTRKGQSAVCNTPNALKGIPAVFANASSSGQTRTNQWQDAGLSFLAQERVAVVLLAGGLGTRVGHSGSKGMLDIGLPSHRSLFQILMEKILAQQQKAADHFSMETVTTEIYIMTSPMLYASIVNTFEVHDFFALERSQVHFFNQN